MRLLNRLCENTIWLVLLGGSLNCSGRQGSLDPADAVDGAKKPTPAQPGGAGNEVASGGQSGGSSGGHPGPACYCGFGPLALARLVNTGESGHCAVFELLEHPEGMADDYYGLRVGDRFGGRAELLCDAPFDVDEGEEVYVDFIPANTAGSECPEYLQCSDEQCGDASALDGLPSEEYEASAADFDRCITACQRDTAEACEAHAEESLFSGRLSVARADEQGRVIFVDSETYAVPADQLLAQDCRPNGVPERQVVSDVVDVAGKGSSGPEAAEPPPAPEPDQLSCPVP